MTTLTAPQKMNSFRFEFITEEMELAHPFDEVTINMVQTFEVEALTVAEAWEIFWDQNQIPCRVLGVAHTHRNYSQPQAQGQEYYLLSFTHPSEPTEIAQVVYAKNRNTPVDMNNTINSLEADGLTIVSLEIVTR